jgi:uncharacterized protein (TIGR02246 family)
MLTINKKAKEVRMTTVAVSQLSAEDRALIDDLIAKYNRSLDTGDKAEFVSLYTDSGAWVSPLEGTFQGRQAIGDWFDEFYSRTDSAFHHGQHRVSNVIIESVSANRCEVWCNWVFVASKNGPHITTMGNYLDVLVKEDGRWLFEKRTIEITAQNG